MGLFFKPQNFIILLSTLLLGFSAALFAPLLGLFFTQDIGVSAPWLSFYFVSSTIAGVWISQWQAKHSDTNWRRAGIVKIAALSASIGAAAFYWFSQFWVLWLVGVSFIALTSSALPQLFAMAREQINDDEAPLFLSVQRATISLSWIVGPPLAFYLSALIGFRLLMLYSSLAYLVVFALAFLLPNVKLTAPKTAKAKANITLVMWILCASFVLMFAANNLYIIGMPLYVTADMQLPQWVPGALMGLAAGLEIPVMIFAALLVKRFNVHLQTVVAAVCGVLFYIGLMFAQDIWQMLVLQLFNGVLIGVTAGIVISYFQHLMPEYLGTASTLYNNSIKIGGGIGAALISLHSLLGDYQFVFVFASSMMFAALALLLVLTIIAARQLEAAHLKARLSAE